MQLLEFVVKCRIGKAMIDIHKSCKLKIVSPKDVNEILNVYSQCEDFLALGPDPKASAKMVLDDLEHSRCAGGVFYGIFDTHEQMMGVVDFVPSGFDGKPHRAFLSLLMIALSYRGQGLGAKVVQAVETEMRKDPLVTEIGAAVQVNNPQAVRFWQRVGYEIVGGPEWMSDQTTVYHLLKKYR